MPSKTTIDPVLESRVDAILAGVRAEVLAAAYKHAPMNSAHEGYAVIIEEVDELWDHVKADTGYTDEAMDEAVQIAAMGVRYVLDLSEADVIAPPRGDPRSEPGDFVELATVTFRDHHDQH